MPAKQFTVEARAADLSNLGPISDYSSLEVHPRFNAVGSWSLTYPASSRAASLLKAGRGVRIVRNGSTTPVLTGPVNTVSETIDNRKNPLLTFTGFCDNVWLGNRLAYPVPSADLLHQTDEYDIRAGAVETVMHGYVNDNLGPGALTARQVPGLTLAVDAGRGGTTSQYARFDNILVLLQQLALSSGLGFQVQQLAAGGPLVYSVYTPTDRSATIRFSTTTGSLGSYTFGLTGPDATVAIVGDGTSGVGRAFAEFINTVAESDWQTRRETFVDNRNTTNFTAITQSGQQALDSGSPQAQVQYTPIDTPQRRYGIDYGLGDVVTVAVETGTVVDVVREVAITDGGSGITTSPVVGGPGATDQNVTPAIYAMFRGLAVRLGLLERRY